LFLAWAGNGLWMYYHSKHNDNFNRQSQPVPYDWIRRVMFQEIGWRKFVILQRKIETTKNTKVHENQRAETRMPFTL